jgi:hypothetical protein
MNKILGIIAGLIFLILPIYVWIINFAQFGSAAAIFLKGGLVWLSILTGTIILSVAISELREN